MADSMLLHWAADGRAWVSVWRGGEIIAKIDMPLRELKAQADQFQRAIAEVEKTTTER